MTRTTFSRKDLGAIEEAVREVEARSPGEVVPYAVDRSDGYPEAAWVAATLGGLVGGLAAGSVYAALGGWIDAPSLWIAAGPAAGAAAGYLLAMLWPALRVHLTHAAVVERRVHQRALAAFVEQEVFRTRERTGMLIFLSLLEHRVIVMADTGISARVPQHEWDGIVTAIVGGIRQGQPGPALAAAIRRCGDLLADHGFRRRRGDRDELSDELRHRPE